MTKKTEVTMEKKIGDLPVYQHSAGYAQEHGELEAYRASHEANVACWDMIETAIAENYRDNRLCEGAVAQVVEQFGYERLLYVLANTVKEKENDGRISQSNREWAKAIPVAEDKDAWNQNHNRYFIVDRCNPGLVDLFIKQIRKEYQKFANG